MCGRVVTASGPEELSEYLGVDAVVDVLDGPDHNVAPSGRLPIAWEEASGHGPDGSFPDGRASRRLLGTARWGLVPRWAKDPSFGERTFNARGETVATKPSYRSAFRRRRCVVPVDGFYEWGPGTARPGGPTGKVRKQPWYVRRADGAPMAMAGLWEDWIDPADEGDTVLVLRTCTVVTVEANAEMAPVHHRMPAVLEADDWAIWLDPTADDPADLGDLLVPAADGILQMHPVDRKVGDARRKGPGLTDPIDPGAFEGSAATADGSTIPGQESLW